MSPEEYRDLIEQLGLTQNGAAKLLGVDERTARRWAKGQRDIPHPVQRFLKLLRAIGMSGPDAMECLE